MLAILRSMRLPSQISLGALIVISTIFAVLTYIISDVLKDKFDEVATEHQHTEATLVANQLESEYLLTSKTLTRMARLMALELDDNVRLENGQVLFHGQPLAQSHTLRNMHDVTDTEVALVRPQSNQFTIIEATSKALQNAGTFRRANSNNSAFRTTIGDEQYFVKTSPITTSGLHVAALIPMKAIYTDMAKRFKDITFGKNGYVYVTDTGERENDILIHPSLMGENFYDLYPKLRNEFKTLYTQDSGITYYTALIAGMDSKPQQTKAIFQHVKGWNWVVVIKTYSNEYYGLVSQVIWLIAGICAISALALILILWQLVTRSLSALNNIVAGVQQIGDGNLTYHFDHKVSKQSRNETHILQTAIQKMRDDLLRLIHAIEQTGQELVHSSNKISEVNSHLTSSANQSTGTSMEVASAIEQISASTEEVASSAMSVSEQSTKVNDITLQGYQSVQQVENTISNLHSSFERAAETIKDVESRTTNIGEVVGVINDIAEQTNLLALNAAIEAARAGEQGRGFAVVADEVRVLAQRTQQSTEEIQNVVASLQQSSRSAVNTMQDGRDQVELSVKQATDAGMLLKQIQESMNTVAEGIANVAASTEEQSVAATQIKGNADQLYQAANQTLTEVNDSQAESHRIHDLTNDLKQQLARFST